MANDDAVLALFNSLPPAFDAIIKPLEVMENITLEKAKQALLNEELLQKQKSDNLSDALFASKGGRGRPTHNSDHRVTCNHCKKEGHKASACFILHPELKRIPRKPQHNTHASDSGKSGDNNNTHKNNNAKYNNNNSKNKQNIKEGFVAVASALMADVTDGNWYLDSGASNHMCTDKSIFIKIVADNTPVRVGNKDLIQATGKGTVCFQVETIDTVTELTLSDVLYIPNFYKNLLSVSALEKRGATIVFQNGSGKIYNRNGHLFAQAIRQANDLYLLNVYKDVGEGSNANCQIAETNTATGEEMGNCLDSYTNPTHKTINDDRGGNLTISLSDITGEKVGNCPSTPTPNNANGLGAVSFLSENKNYVGDQKAGNCPSNSTTSALVGKITAKEASQPLVDTATNNSNSNSSNNISNININNDTIEVQQAGNCPSKTPINNNNNTIEVQQAGNCPSNTSTNNINNSIVLWHNRLAHINPQRIKLMLAGLVMGGSKLAGGVLLDCLACAHKRYFKNTRHTRHHKIF